MFSFKRVSLAVCLFLLVRRRATCAETTDSVSVLLHQSNITRLTARAIHAAGYHLHLVQHITIMDAPKLEHIAVEDLTKMPNLKSLFITQAPLLHKVAPLPPLPELRTFIITTSGLLEVPNLIHVHDQSKAFLQAVSNEVQWTAIRSTLTYNISDLEGNHISRIPPHALRIRADQVSLNYNLIEEVPPFAFKNAQISKLSFKGNTKLNRLNEQAFAGNLLLRQLDLSNTAITSLPTKGLEKLEILRIEKTPSLKYIPSIYEFQNLEKAFLTHHFHCCAFAFPERHDPARHKLYETQLAIMVSRCNQNGGQQTSSARRKRSHVDQTAGLKITSKGGADGKSDGAWSSISEEESTEANTDLTFSEGYISDIGSFEDEDDGGFHEPINNTLRNGAAIFAECGNVSSSRRQVECTPIPNELNPCEDVMGWSWLRASVWLVVMAAVVGNLAVLLVLLANHNELTVPRFLMCHLALADLFTGLYLSMLAVVDLKSYGEFFNYAYDWQYGFGCKIAGFLSVFSGLLSVFTLTIVTLERWFAITYAIYLERRISMASAAKIMIGGWVFSFLMAGLPLVGVSDYSSTSICQPVESVSIGDAVYQGSLFMINALAWVIIVICYVQIYRSLGGGGESYGGRGAAAAAERKIANKMALLIGTDLLCWAPVAFFGVTALAGIPLVDVSHGKVLLVFFYPLNACANPFLYAILTKQYRRDLLTLIARSGKCNWLIERYKLGATPPPTAHTHPSTPGTMVPLVETSLYQRSQSQLTKQSNGDDVAALV